jgi:hypothetical protein|tara:strand:+ start:613 stop:825 length:213 start_codon:yes stop_codon:yes gene_type:complete
MITNTLEDDMKYSFKVNGEWIDILKSEAPNMGVAYDLLAEMQKPVEAPAPVKKEKKQKKAKPEVVEEKEE